MTLISPVHLVHTPPHVPYSSILLYERESDPPSPSHLSSPESVKLKVNPMLRNNPPNPVPKIPADPDQDPSLSDSSLSDSSDSSDEEYYKQKQRANKDKTKCRIKTNFDEPIKKCAKLTTKLLIAV